MRELRLLEQNVVYLAGNVGRDPDFKVTSSGTHLCTFRLGVGRRFKDMKSGEWKDDTTWVTVDVWRDAAERLKDRLKKGSAVHIEGRLKSEEYEDKQGQKRSVLKVVARRVQVLDKRTSSQSSSGAAASNTDLEEVPF